MKSAPQLIAGLVLAAAVLSPATGFGQELSVSFGDEGTLSSRTIQLILLITVLSLAPGLLMMLTCFPFLVTVLAILRQAIGLQQSPPNMLLISLALFLTYFVMEPVFSEAWRNGLLPLMEDRLGAEEAIEQALIPFRGFMAARVDADTFVAIAELRPGPNGPATQRPEAPLSILLPSFLLSELSRAFQIGFLIFLPFLIIDLVVAAILMSMGMMMVPPAIVSPPFKLAFFVIADGWSLIAAALVRGYGT